MLNDDVARWADGANAAAAQYPALSTGTSAGSLTVAYDDETPGITVPLTAWAVRDLADMLRRKRHQSELQEARIERDKKIVAAIVEAVRDDQDGGDVVAVALRRAAKTLFRPWYLIIGRPGSWEAADVEAMYSSASGVADASGPQVDQLAVLFADIGRGRDQGLPEDGGQTLSWVLGAAANELGSIEALCGHGVFSQQVANLAMQYANDAVRSTSPHH